MSMRISVRFSKQTRSMGGMTHIQFLKISLYTMYKHVYCILWCRQIIIYFLVKFINIWGYNKDKVRYVHAHILLLWFFKQKKYVFDFEKIHTLKLVYVTSLFIYWRNYIITCMIWPCVYRYGLQNRSVPLELWEAGQIGPKPNRPPSQIGPKSKLLKN
jgi:hypothetical protein